MGTARARDVFMQVLEETRQRFRFVMLGFVVMPEHVHWLITEPRRGTPSTAMQVLKQRVARKLRARPGNSAQGTLWGAEPLSAFWQRRFYDFNVWSAAKRVEKLKYMHRNPVARKLVNAPQDWRWSSYRYYADGERGVVQVDVGWEIMPAVTRGGVHSHPLPAAKSAAPTFWEL